MDAKEAQERFEAADELFRDGGYAGALKHLDALDEAFPGNHRVLNAKARTLAQLGRFEESLRICTRLIDVYGYDKIRPFRDRVAARAAQGRKLTPRPELPPALPKSEDTVSSPGMEDGGEGEIHFETEVAPEKQKKRWIKISPLRIILLLLVLLAGWRGLISYPVAAGIIAGYFVVKLLIKYLIGKLLVRLFMLPFHAKGRALQGATAEIHDVEPAAAPPASADEDGEEARTKEAVVLKHAWVELTISPQPRAKGFVHWEPGELALAPSGRKIRTMDDHDHCFHVLDVKVIEDGQELQDEGYKLVGPRRIRLLVGVPEQERDFQFVYYATAFGHLHID